MVSNERAEYENGKEIFHTKHFKFLNQQNSALQKRSIWNCLPVHPSKDWMTDWLTGLSMRSISQAHLTTPPPEVSFEGASLTRVNQMILRPFKSIKRPSIRRGASYLTRLRNRTRISGPDDEAEINRIIVRIRTCFDCARNVDKGELITQINDELTFSIYKIIHTGGS